MCLQRVELAGRKEFAVAERVRWTKWKCEWREMRKEELPSWAHKRLHYTRKPLAERRKRWKNKNEINIIFYFCNERDRNFMLFMFCTTIQISLNCYGSLIIPTSKQCHVCLAPERDDAIALLSRRWFQETWSTILRCICMNGSVLWEMMHVPETVQATGLRSSKSVET